MLLDTAIEETVTEARRLCSLPIEDRETQGVYASRSDLNQLIKTLQKLARSSENKVSLEGLIRRTADFSERNSKLFSLIVKVVEVYEN
ncbi:hypothetical protein [Aurantivibrio infirmus]